MISVGVVTVAVAFIVVGVVGASQYVKTFWLYRGFAAPARINSVVVGSGAYRRRVTVVAGTVGTISVTSRAIGGAGVRVTVYLPPGYVENRTRRYPVFYLLCGFPGQGSNFVTIGDIAVTADTLIAEGRIRPMLLVMPNSATSFFVDNEWVNGVRPHTGWETFVARDVVGSIDHRYRTITRGSDRAIGGLSEGGYGSLNIAFHHLGEFDLVEGWSAYFTADYTTAFFGGRPRLYAYNSPALEVQHVAAKIRADHLFVWFYSGLRDPTRFKSRRFNSELEGLRIPHRYFETVGHHNWRLWRSEMVHALEVASDHFAVGDGA
jgi:enterochelin esterase-like enzyme